jgi:hypothetical protein
MINGERKTVLPGLHHNCLVTLMARCSTILSSEESNVMKNLQKVLTEDCTFPTCWNDWQHITKWHR